MTNVITMRRNSRGVVFQPHLMFIPPQVWYPGHRDCENDCRSEQILKKTPDFLFCDRNAVKYKLEAVFLLNLFETHLL